MGYKCKICGKEYKSNISGACNKHLKKHVVDVNNIEEYFDIVQILDKPKKGIHCPICDKVYKNNLGGAITNHLIKEHGYIKDNVKKDFPQLFLEKKEYNYGSTTRTCVICGKEFEYKKHIHRKTKKTCSKECASQLISNIKTNKTKSICKICNKEFEHKKSKSPRFCSIQCKAASQQGKQDYQIQLDLERIQKKYEDGMSCETIGREFGVNKKLIRSRLVDLGITLRDGYYSSVEDEIIEWLSSLGIINIIKGDKSVLEGKELDIYIPDYNLAIEYNGLYWHSELRGRDKNYHLNKTLECEKHGINLLHIFEDEWVNKQEIVKNIIRMKLGIVKHKIGARKCIIKEIESKDTQNFLEENHIQGYIPSKVNLGLYYQNSLISVLTFRKSRFNKQYDWEITRYVNKSGYSIMGGFSKLLKHFTENYPGSIITYSDKRLFDGQVYESNGFIRLKSSSPNYYYTKGLDRQSRQQFQKHKLQEKLEIFDSEFTEVENMRANGWDRIWDCGNSIFRLE